MYPSYVSKFLTDKNLYYSTNYNQYIALVCLSCRIMNLNCITCNISSIECYRPVIHASNITYYHSNTNSHCSLVYISLVTSNLTIYCYSSVFYLVQLVLFSLAFYYHLAIGIGLIILILSSYHKVIHSNAHD